MPDQLSSISMPASTTVTPGCDCYVHRFGSIAPGRRARCYPSDMTDAEWAEVRSAMPVPAWLLKQGGRPEAYCHRAMLDAIGCLVDNGQCRCLRGASSSSPGHGDCRGAGSLTGHASVDARRVLGAQYQAVLQRVTERVEGRLDLPSLVIELHQLGCGVSAVVGERGCQSVMTIQTQSFGGRHRDVRVDDPQPSPVDPGQERSVRKQRPAGGCPGSFEPYQQLCAGGRGLREEVVGVEAPVVQQQHAVVQQRQQLLGVAGLLLRRRPEDSAEQGPVPGLAQCHDLQHRISVRAIAVLVLAQPGADSRPSGALVELQPSNATVRQHR
ncbi:hypothetical protein FHX80_1317 [Streptomyces brevispora]|uniref:Uncharacterized protein n=1 Tax=Streptomyces brevispora TaxID=887462 RepID=A0A561TU07_9ACTN|nr:hypothetical protein FHX80_1317 [Streptomyces brevispora]